MWDGWGEPENAELRSQVDVGFSSVHPESPSMKRGGKNTHYKRNENYKSSSKIISLGECFL